MDLADLTVITESYAGDDAEMLTFMLDRARAQFAWKVGDLDTEALRRRLPSSDLTLGGLLNHCAAVEHRIVARFLTATPVESPWDDDAADFAVEHLSADVLNGRWRREVARSQVAWAQVLAGGLGELSPLVLRDGTRVSYRRPYVDLIEHYLRHTGHADLIRESIDGLVGEDPPQPETA